MHHRVSVVIKFYGRVKQIIKTGISRSRYLFFQKQQDTMSLNPCTIPTICQDLEGDDRWSSIVSTETCVQKICHNPIKKICIYPQHKRFIQDSKEKDPDVIFIGDCILESLQFTEYWNESFAPLHCLNFSIRSDQTQNVLWRILNGGLESVKTKVNSFKSLQGLL